MKFSGTHKPPPTVRRCRNRVFAVATKFLLRVLPRASATAVATPLQISLCLVAPGSCSAAAALAAAAAMAGPCAYRLGVSSLPVAPSVRSVRLPAASQDCTSVRLRECAALLCCAQKLEEAGFHTRGDLEHIGPVDLARGASTAVAVAHMSRPATPGVLLVHLDLRRAAPVTEADLTHEEALSVLRESGSRFVTQSAVLPGAHAAPLL